MSKKNIWWTLKCWHPSQNPKVFLKGRMKSQIKNFGAFLNTNVVILLHSINRLNEPVTNISAKKQTNDVIGFKNTHNPPTHRINQ